MEKDGLIPVDFKIHEESGPFTHDQRINFKWGALPEGYDGFQKDSEVEKEFIEDALRAGGRRTPTNG